MIRRFALLGALSGILAFTVMPALAQEDPQRAGADAQEQTIPLTGSWLGEIGSGDEAYSVVLHIERLRDGSLRATGESPETGVSGVESRNIELNDGELRIEFEGARFVGGWNDGSSLWEGYWRSADGGEPMTLARLP
jgi:hypothetical protein